MSSKHKIVHLITNHVTKQFVADAVTIYGASPIMSETPEEYAAFYPNVKALVINLGMLDENRKALIKSACQLANEYKIPIVADMVGIHFSPYRHLFALGLMQSFDFAVIKGNYDEVLSLQTGGSKNTFESDTDILPSEAEKDFHRLASSYPHTAFLATGVVDYLFAGSESISICGGSTLLKKLSGTGCVLSGLIGAELTLLAPSFNVSDVIRALQKVTSFYKCASERAEFTSNRRIGQFKSDLLSEIEVHI